MPCREPLIDFFAVSVDDETRKRDAEFNLFAKEALAEGEEEGHDDSERDGKSHFVKLGAVAPAPNGSRLGSRVVASVSGSPQPDVEAGAATGFAAAFRRAAARATSGKPAEGATAGRRPGWQAAAGLVRSKAQMMGVLSRLQMTRMRTFMSRGSTAEIAGGDDGLGGPASPGAAPLGARWPSLRASVLKLKAGGPSNSIFSAALALSSRAAEEAARPRVVDVEPGGPAAKALAASAEQQVALLSAQLAALKVRGPKPGPAHFFSKKSPKPSLFP